MEDTALIPTPNEHVLEKLIEESKWAIPDEHIRIHFRSDPNFYNRIINEYSEDDTIKSVEKNFMEDMVNLKRTSVFEFKKELHESIKTFTSVAIQRFVKKKENLKKIEALQKEFLSYVNMYKAQEIDKVKLLIIAQKAFTKDEIDKLCDSAAKSFENSIEQLIKDFIFVLESMNKY